MDKFGKLIREARIQHKESTKKLAKIIKCSEATIKHIEGSKTVPISPRLIKGLKSHFKSIAILIEKSSKQRNAIGKKWYAEYRKRATN
jgi:ribosome-binding protein aMBF1 (putative translation factor)